MIYLPDLLLQLGSFNPSDHRAKAKSEGLLSNAQMRYGDLVTINSDGTLLECYQGRATPHSYSERECERDTSK